MLSYWSESNQLLETICWVEPLHAKECNLNRNRSWRVVFPFKCQGIEMRTENRHFLGKHKPSVLANTGDLGRRKKILWKFVEIEKNLFSSLPFLLQRKCVTHFVWGENYTLPDAYMSKPLWWHDKWVFSLEKAYN